jgi:cytochrome d ubiquinol oxidase subunit I
MEEMLPSALDLARFQFAFTVVWHFLFPAFTIGLASYLAVLEALWLWTGRPVYLDTFRYWVKAFAVAFAMGVVSGIVLSYQIGTNWSVFADRTAPVLGPLFAYEVLAAFFLEAGFIGVMLFGLDRVGRGLHFLATCLVELGPHCRHSGSYRRIPGCRRPAVIRSPPTAASCPRAGLRSSSTPPSPTVSRIP